MSNLTPADIEAIERIVKAKLEHYNLIQPSPPKMRYVRCIQSIFGFQDKHIYELKQILTNDTESGVIYDGKQWSSYAQYRMFFMPASEEEYQAQQQVGLMGENSCIHKEEQQIEWKVGEWCKTSLGKIFFIEEVGKSILGSTQENENDTILVTQEAIKFCTKPTEQEIFNHLRGIAEKKYPVGCKVKTHDVKELVSNGCFSSGGKDCLYLESDETQDGHPVWVKKYGWAKQVEDVKDRYKVNTRQNHSKFEIIVYSIETKTEATEFAQKIKQLLTNI